ncbi:PREDICTED: uncharacterized protein LOC106751216 [Dinoponera quadriceps]|uniref:Uncharacterized protein LOC106751216 n=1 Tax=Dinoponera quadriceps TaxID=609295 RepID=A0A6P3YCD9_DINQU|nr:PREDICTED: uncharacterized protein LOC106751216 [Dinoponera quadriceps]
MSDDESIDRPERNVKVFVRVLPLGEPLACDSYMKISGDRKTFSVRHPQDVRRDRKSADSCPVYWAFPTDGTFHEASQDTVYRTVAGDLVEKGIVARLLSDMFAAKANRRKVSDIRYRLSFVELTSRNVIDLLTARRPKVNVKNVNDVFENVIAVDVQNEPQALKRLFEGEARRSIVMAATYPVSHLAAAVITFHASNTSLIMSRAVVATAKIHVVEMAGIGTVGKSSCSKPASDVGMANLMKSQLEQYFLYLREPSVSIYGVARRSNLSRLLKNEFTVTSVIRFISHVRVTKEDLAVTLSTMRLTMKIARLRPIRTTRHVRPQAELTLQRLREEVNALRKELRLNDMFLRQEALANISRTRAEQIGRDAMNFLKGSISELTLFNVTQARILMKIVKQLYNKLVAKGDEEKLSEAYEDVMNSLMPADATLPPATSSQVPELHKIDSDDVFNRGENLTSEMSRGTDDKKTAEQVGILIKHGISLGPVLQTDSMALGLKYPAAPKLFADNDEMQMTTELTHECVDKAKIL